MNTLARIVILSAFVLASAAPVYARGGSYSSHSSSHSYSYGSRSSGHVNPNSHSVHGYTRKDGTYVAPHHATNPNGTRNDNYSTRGNVNPWTGQPGTKSGD